MRLRAQSELQTFAFRPARVAWSLLPVSLVLFSVCALAQQLTIPPPPRAWLTDTVGLLSPETRQALNQKLEAFERKTGHQLVVWIGDSAGGAPLEELATRTFERWRVGRQGLDDGLLVIVLARDRKIAVEVGYGLEDRVPDAVASRVIREVMAPRLAAGDADGALTAGVDTLIAAIAKADAAEPKRPEPRPWSTGRLLLLALVSIGFLVLLATHPSLALSLLWVLMSGRGGGPGGGLGGGVFSGGGGRSGGGGARGGW